MFDWDVLVRFGVGPEVEVSISSANSIGAHRGCPFIVSQTRRLVNALFFFAALYCSCVRFMTSNSLYPLPLLFQLLL